MTSMLPVLLTLAQTTPSGASLGGTGSWLVYGLVLLAVAAAFFVVEVFLPTGGLLGVLSGLAAVAGVFCLFKMNTTLGAVGAGVVLLATPVLLVLAIKIWPDTPFGQWVTHRNEPPASDQPDAPAPDGHAEIAPGDTGRTVTPLRPVGVCLLNGRRRECYARSGSIDPDVEVEVVSISRNEVHVRPASRPDA